MAVTTRITMIINRCLYLVCLLIFSSVAVTLHAAVDTRLTKDIARLTQKSTELPKIELEELNEKRITRLVKHYKKYVAKERSTQLVQGALKIGLIGSIVYGFYYLTSDITENTDAKVKEPMVRRIINDSIIATIVVLLTGGLNSATGNISQAWENFTAKSCDTIILQRFLYEVKRYKFLVASLNEETPFISDREIITAFNQITIALEHVIAWQHASTLSPKQKTLYNSLNSFIYALDEYKTFLLQARETKWNETYRKKFTSYTHSFLNPWIELLTPEIPHD